MFSRSKFQIQFSVDLRLIEIPCISDQKRSISWIGYCLNWKDLKYSRRIQFISKVKISLLIWSAADDLPWNGKVKQSCKYFPIIPVLSLGSQKTTHWCKLTQNWSSETHSSDRIQLLNIGGADHSSLIRAPSVHGCHADHNSSIIMCIAWWKIITN